MITIGVTGPTGAMGEEVVSHLVESNLDVKIKAFILISEKTKLDKYYKKIYKKHKNKISLIYGDIFNKNDVSKFVDGCDYIVHCAALIPPKSDHNPERTYNTNFIGTKNIVDCIEESKKDIKLIHISTVAVYGHRNYKHPWARIGDPVISSAYDYYSASKLKGERYVLESALKYYVVLRQTAIFHKKFFSNNLNDGLMFHTIYNVPFEWITDIDSGNLITKIIEKDASNELNYDFYRKCYNIGGGALCRNTGYETAYDSFNLMHAKPEDFFKPNWNIQRNFHGVWFSDSDILENMFHYRNLTNADYWRLMKKKYWYFSLAVIVPKFLIRKMVIERLFKNSNVPLRWIKLKKKGRIDAFFNGIDNYNKLPTKWDNYPLLAKGKTEDGDIDYNLLKDEKNSSKYLLNHGYDETKPDNELSIEDFRSAAKYRGGNLISTIVNKGDLYTPLIWEDHEGHKFISKPYTILKAGFWSPLFDPSPWKYDGIAPYIPFYAQVYYDSHDLSEKDRVYPYNSHEDDDMIE